MCTYETKSSMKINGANTDNNEKDPQSRNTICYSFRIRTKENNHQWWNQEEENIGDLETEKL